MAQTAFDLKVGHIRKENVWKKSSRRYGGLRSVGGGAFYGNNNRLQRCVVKISYSKNTPTRSWAAHGQYLQRENAQQKDAGGKGFNASDNNLDIKDTLKQWQESGDERFFKVIISPENGHRLDLQQHAKDLMKRVQTDLGTKIEWVAIDHHDTDQPHLHLLIRGVDETGKELRINPTYIAKGFRHRSQEIATRELGLRTQHDIQLGRQRQIDKPRVTEIDRSLRYKAKSGVVDYSLPLSANSLTYTNITSTALRRERRLQEIARLKYLESLNLAKQVAPKTWQLNENLEQTLHEMQLAGDIIKTRARHGHGVINLKENLVPTQITHEQSLTGKVIGMGLEDELRDRRYLLLESNDGKVHYIQATPSIVKARDTRKFKNGDIITLSQSTFTNHKGQLATYIHVKKHISKRLENKKGLTCHK